MALQVVEFFGFPPLDQSQNAKLHVSSRHCPFVDSQCLKPKHGACSVRQAISTEEIICCPNRLYADEYLPLRIVSDQVFGQETKLVKHSEIDVLALAGNEVAVFGRYWGRELPLPRPPASNASKTRKYYVDWILAKLSRSGEVEEFTAIEVQSVDTTGNYRNQAQSFFRDEQFVDAQGRSPGYSNAGLNWENVNKRILTQVIYKGHVLRREAKCRKGLFFVCPKQVYDRVRERLGGHLHEYQPDKGTITFVSFELVSSAESGKSKALVKSGQFTTTVDQIAVAFTGPVNLPDQNVYEIAILEALQR